MRLSRHLLKHLWTSNIIITQFVCVVQWIERCCHTFSSDAGKRARRLHNRACNLFLFIRAVCMHAIPLEIVSRKFLFENRSNPFKCKEFSEQSRRFQVSYCNQNGLHTNTVSVVMIITAFFNVCYLQWCNVQINQLKRNKDFYNFWHLWNSDAAKSCYCNRAMA